MASALMVQGTTSDAGKSTLVAALCRLLVRRGVRVAPFKPQNMALNSAVTADGGEIGRAQAVQAQAARPGAAHRHEPGAAQAEQRHRRAGHHPRPRDRQHGRASPITTTRRVAMQAVLESHAAPARRSTTWSSSKAPAARPRSTCATGDIANMGFAEAVDCPVILIADIDRGGVFAHLVGTLALLSRQRAGARQRLRHQPLSRRPRAAAARPRLAGSSAPASRCSACCPTCTACTWRPRMRIAHAAERQERRRAAARHRAGAAAHQQPHRLRSAAPASAGRASASSARASRSRRPT